MSMLNGRGGAGQSHLDVGRQAIVNTVLSHYLLCGLFDIHLTNNLLCGVAAGPCRWLTLAAVAPDPSSPSRQEYMGGFVLSVVADVAEFVAAPVGDGWRLAAQGAEDAGGR